MRIFIQHRLAMLSSWWHGRSRYRVGDTEYLMPGWQIVYPECMECGCTLYPRQDGTRTPCRCDVAPR